jgi:hypothetical protein
MLAATPAARADAPGQCHVVGISFVPSNSQLQIVGWVEQTDGTFVATVYITNKVGMYGLGNRPGRFDLNSGPPSSDLWPYGRRVTTFPVWAHRHGLSWPEVDFQNGDDDDVSHPANQSSAELTPPYCRPMISTDKGWDAGTCATPQVFSDKGIFSTSATSLYPPRSDLTFTSCGDDPPCDSSSVNVYKSMNPFDAVTQATPPGGMSTTVSWPIPQGLAAGNYVLFMEVAQEYDYNATYNSTSYPSPQDIPFNNYGVPYRGQPSIVYQVPFTIGTSEDIETTQSYAGYGDPTGASGTLNPPDSTITTDTPASGASRFEALPGTSNVVSVDARPITDSSPPADITGLATANVTSVSVDVTFIAPSDVGGAGVSGYDVRVRANDPITDANFDSSMPVTATIVPNPAGSPQAFEIDGLLPETPYWVGIRAFDACHNESNLAVVTLTTAQRENGTVDACFVATAAYGSLMANDVELLRTFRDRMLKSNAIGELFVETYYTFGPPVAGIVGDSELLRATARGVLAPLIDAVRKIIPLGPASPGRAAPPKGGAPAR